VPPIRFLALDIDGTLLDSSWQLPAENAKEIARAVDRGVEVALVTGRRYDFARPIADLFDVPLTLITSNGAVVKDRNGHTLARRVLPRSLAAEVLARTERWRDCAALLFDRPGVQVVFERLGLEDERRRKYYELNREAVIEHSPLEACLDDDPIQIMFSGPVERMRALRTFLRPNGACEFSVSITEYEQRDFALVDVMASGCSKGFAVSEWATLRGYARDEVMAIGDNLNDLEMLQFAGLPVVMANACPSLLSSGWHLTASNDDSGVAVAIRRFVTGGQ
jgi:Cof subfamily protein (haloacid dehalogenase superfamily)